MTTMTMPPTPVLPLPIPVLVGKGEAVERLRLQIARIAPHFRMALLIGEHGTGKQEIAREMYRLCPARTLPFASLPAAAFAQQVAGYTPCGVLYLHGLERLDTASQGDLLLRLQTLEREQRVIFSSECDLRGMLATGKLRPELLARLGSLQISVAPLRARAVDLEDLIEAILQSTSARIRLGAAALDRMRDYPWPGNLEELAQYLHTLAAPTGEDGYLQPEDLPAFPSRQAALSPAPPVAMVRLDQVVKRHVLGVLLQCAGNKLKAAELLGISRSTLYRMLDSVLPAEEQGRSNHPAAHQNEVGATSR